MAAASNDPLMPTGEVWENVKFQIFQAMTMWEIIMSKVQTQQPDNPSKRLYQLFEEVEEILDMFQMEISNSCKITINDNATNDVKYIIPDKNISRFLGISPQSTRIYLSSKEESGLAASELVKVQLDATDDRTNGYIENGEDTSSLLVKTEIKAEVLEDEEDFEPMFSLEDEEAPLAPKKKVNKTSKERLAFLKNQEYSSSFPVSEEDFEKMKAGTIERKCPRCDKAFENKFGMIRHFRGKKKNCSKEYVAPRHDLYITSNDEVTGKKIYSCSFPTCPKSDKTWKEAVQVFQHWEQMHSETIDLPVVCDHCPSENKKRFLVTATLNKHIGWAHPEIVGRGHKCKICGKTTNNLKKLQRHERTHDKDYRWNRGIVEYRYQPEFPVSETEFEQMVAGKAPRKCPKCAKSFKSINKIMKHFSMKRRDCSSFVQVRSDLSIDVKDEATGKLRFACAFPNCPESEKTWLAKLDVSRHWETKHTEFIEMPVVCDYCPKRFLLTATQKQHIRTFHPEKLGLEYHCAKCGKQFKNLKQLIGHEKTHQDKTYLCDYCDYRTNTQAHKTQHMKYNHAEQMGIEVQFHQCEHCGKEFRMKSNLKQHIESAHSHRPDPKYKCPICAKQLKQDNSFRKHMANVHQVGERCTLCNKLYKNKEALEKHLKQVHEESLT